MESDESIRHYLISWADDLADPEVVVRAWGWAGYRAIEVDGPNLPFGVMTTVSVNAEE